MSPLEKIKIGILNGDMKMVSDGYEDLTGEAVCEETEITADEDPPVENALPDTSEDEFIAPIRKGDTETSNSRLAKFQTIDTSSPRDNKFVDDGVEHSDIETPDSPRSPRTRTSKKTVELKCHICGKEELVHQDLVRDFYRCSNCCRK